MARLSEDEIRIRRMVGSRIRELRQALDLRATELAARAGISQSQLSKLENGKASISIPVLTSLCRVLDRPLSYLFQKEEEIPRVLGTMTTVSGPENRGLMWFASEVNRRSGGHMSIIPLWATVLGSAPDQVAMLRQGVIDLFIEELIFYQHLAPAVKLISLPYVFSDDAHLLSFLGSPFFQERVREPLAKSGIRILNRRWNWRRGLERVLVARRPITRPQEVKGLKVRIFDSPALARFWEELGARPVVVPWPRVREAWEAGEFDLLPTHRSHLYPLGFCRQGRFVTLLGDVPPALAVTVNEQKYLSLPPAVQSALVESCDAAGEFFSEEIRRAEVGNQEANLRQYGAVYLQVDLEPWRRAAREVVERLAREGSVDLEAWRTVEALAPAGESV